MRRLSQIVVLWSAILIIFPAIVTIIESKIYIARRRHVRNPMVESAVDPGMAVALFLQDLVASYRRFA